MSDEDRLLKLEADIAQLHAYMEQKAINIAGTAGAYLLCPSCSCQYNVASLLPPRCSLPFADIFGRKFSVPVDAEHVRAAMPQALPCGIR
eukprot:6189742-Pleurochrysis_carterae.AAC.2